MGQVIVDLTSRSTGSSPEDERGTGVEPGRGAAAATGGAIISGRRTFDIAHGWKDGHPVDVPIFVVTHHAPTSGAWSPRVSFVTDGIDHALELAQETAGERIVSIAGASVAQQLLRDGKLDEIQVSVAPVLLGSGVRLFDAFGLEPVPLEQTRVVVSDGVTHLRYRILRD